MRVYKFNDGASARAAWQGAAPGRDLGPQFRAGGGVRSAGGAA
jgi:hypothetical protein